MLQCRNYLGKRLASFAEMTPIFKNVDVSLDDVGEFVQQYAKEHSIKDVAQCLIIGSYFGEKIGLTTPHLQWYLNHGLVIACIYTAVEYILLNVVLKEIVIKTKH